MFRRCLRFLRQTGRAPSIEDFEMEAPRGTDKPGKVPGDTFGLMDTRYVYMEPTKRNLRNRQPDDNVADFLVGTLMAKVHVPYQVAWDTLLENKHSLWRSCRALEKKGLVKPGGEHGLYSVVAFDIFEGETFSCVEFNVKDPEVLMSEDFGDLAHEVALSAAEMPIDTPRSQITSKLIDEWTTEDDEPIRALLKTYSDILKTEVSITSALLLPYGAYAVQGFYMHNELSQDRPNIGDALCAMSLELRSGIHTRFRETVERTADSLAEHVVKEKLHVDQDAHICRQPFWWDPVHSVEEFIRMKERIMEPSMLIHEMKYMCHVAGASQVCSYRNIVELERLKVAEWRYGKNANPHISQGNAFSANDWGLNKSLAAMKGGGTAGNMDSGEGSGGQPAMESEVFRLKEMGMMNRFKEVDRYYVNQFF